MINRPEREADLSHIVVVKKGRTHPHPDTPSTYNPFPKTSGSTN